MHADGIEVEERSDARTWTRWARLCFVALLAWLARSAFHDEYGTMPLLSDIDLAIHEFGHVLFMPFGVKILGDTMMILGGSLVQVAFPLIFAGYFLWPRNDGTRRDPFAASLCVWWSSINLLSVAIYCADSRAGQLMLINGLTGQESDAHDWNNLLTRWGLLQRDTAIAERMRAAAVLLCAGALLCAAWCALQQQTPPPAESVTES